MADQKRTICPGDAIEGVCHLCGARTLVVLPFRYDFKGRFLHGVRCAACSLSFVHPQPSDQEIAALYDEAYFTEHEATCGAHGPGAYMETAMQASPEARTKAARRLEAMIGGASPPRGDFLEIGCGPGFLLAEFRGLGWKTHGLEISEYACRHARDELALAVTLGSIENASFPDGSFDAVFMGDVLEHLPRPVASLRRIHGWLRPEGVLAVAIPSTMNAPSARIGMRAYAARGRFKTLRIPPYHLFEFTPRSVEGVLRAAGFRVRTIRQSTVPLRKIGLRGSMLENTGKVGLQVVAILTTKLLNRGGDRLLVVSVKG